MTPTISRTFTTYEMRIVRLYVSPDGVPAMEDVCEPWHEEVVGVLGDRAARKLAVTNNGGRLATGCTVVYTPVSSHVYTMPVEEFKAAATLTRSIAYDNESQEA